MRLRPDDDGGGSAAAGSSASGGAPSPGSGETAGGGGSGGVPDLFSISASLVADSQPDAGADTTPGGGGGGPGAPPRRVLGLEDQHTLSKLVGCITKEGKRSRAQRVLSDALHIIAAQLRKGGGGGGKGA